MRFGFIVIIFCLALVCVLLKNMPETSDDISVSNNKLSVGREFSVLNPGMDLIIDEFSAAELVEKNIASPLGSFETLVLTHLQIEKYKEENTASLNSIVNKTKRLIKNGSGKDTLAVVTIKWAPLKVNSAIRTQIKQYKKEKYSHLTLLARQSGPQIKQNKKENTAGLKSTDDKTKSLIKIDSSKDNLEVATMNGHPLNVDGVRSPEQVISNAMQLETLISEENRGLPQNIEELKERTIILDKGDFSK